jgi:hypothetical protein
LSVDGARIVISAHAIEEAQIGPVDQSRPVIIAARPQSCVRGGPGNGNWIVTLDPASIFFWTSFEPLVSLGMAEKDAPANDPVRSVINEQRARLGIE